MLRCRTLLSPSSLHIWHLCHVLPLLNVQTLVCTGRCAPNNIASVIMWVHIFMEMPHLRELSIESVDFQYADLSIAGALGEYPVPSPSLVDRTPEEEVKEDTVTHWEITLPNLKILRLSKFPFRRYPMDRLEDSVIPSWCTILEARQRSGCKLGRFVLTECINLDGADVDFFRGLAESVEWDGRRLTDAFPQEVPF